MSDSQRADTLFEAMLLLHNASSEDLLKVVNHFDKGRFRIEPRVEYQQLEFIAERAVREYHEMLFGKPSGHHFSVPNNFVGRFVLWLLRKFLNRTSFKLVLFGREPKYKGARNRFAARLRLDRAKRIAVYIQRKQTTR